jgi:hypothetical protein
MAGSVLLLYAGMRLLGLRPEPDGGTTCRSATCAQPSGRACRGSPAGGSLVPTPNPTRSPVAPLDQARAQVLRRPG